MAGRILLAEDDRALSALIQDFFAAAGMEIVPSYDGASALALALEENFDLLILDVMMPQFSGLEVCRAVREHSAVPILFITALGQEGDALAGYRAGADDYIVKPFSFSSFSCQGPGHFSPQPGPELGHPSAQLWQHSDGHRFGTGLGRRSPPSTFAPKSTRFWSCCSGNRDTRISRDLLIQRVWGVDFQGDERMVDRHVAALRQSWAPPAQHIRGV